MNTQQGVAGLKHLFHVDDTTSDNEVILLFACHLCCACNNCAWNEDRGKGPYCAEPLATARDLLRYVPLSGAKLEVMKEAAKSGNLLIAMLKEKCRVLEARLAHYE